MSDSSRLAAYLRRIGFDPPVSPDLETLQRLQHAHRLAVTFENLDIPLGRGIGLEPDALFDKIVVRRRGGYCFEQNALFLAMLGEIGFVARPILARVWLTADGVPPRTHTFNLVTVEDRDYVADVGFGGSYAPLLPLAEDEIVRTPDGVRHRLMRDPEHGWMLERDGGAGWARQYSFGLEPVLPADLEMANHWTATRPGTRFTTLRIVSRALPDGYASLVETILTVSRSGEAAVKEVATADEYRRLLAEHFDLVLSDAEVAALRLY